MGWFTKHNTYPQFYQDYLDAFKNQPKDLSSTRFVVFDTETTGLNPKKDRVLSIGTVAIKNFKIDVSDHLECYVKQDFFNSDTVQIHGLLKGGNTTQITEFESLKLFLAHIQNAVLVAHHIAFDVAMINEALKRMQLPKLKNKTIDTGYLYKKTKYIKDEKHYSLDALCDMFKIKMHDRHTASGDAYLTAILFLKISALLLQKNKRLKLKHFFNWF